MDRKRPFRTKRVEIIKQADVDGENLEPGLIRVQAGIVVPADEETSRCPNEEEEALNAQHRRAQPRKATQ
jgi:hypothetical protein